MTAIGRPRGRMSSSSRGCVGRGAAAWAVLTCVLFTACSASHESSGSRVATSPPPRSPGTPHRVQTAQTRWAPMTRRCHARDLRISTPGRDVAGTMPGTEAVIRFVNISNSTCTLRGWPSVHAVRRSGARVRVRLDDYHATGAWGWYRTSVVALKPNGVAFASVLIGTPVAAQNDPGCGGAYSWRITAPGDHHWVTSPTHGAWWPQLCPRQTQVVISPVHAPPAV